MLIFYQIELLSLILIKHNVIMFANVKEITSFDILIFHQCMRQKLVRKERRNIVWQDFVYQETSIMVRVH